MRAQLVRILHYACDRGSGARKIGRDQAQLLSRFMCRRKSPAGVGPTPRRHMKLEAIIYVDPFEKRKKKKKRDI